MLQVTCTYLPSREVLKDTTNSGNSISSSALNTSSALIVCLLDSLHISFALHKYNTTELKKTTITTVVSFHIMCYYLYTNKLIIKHLQHCSMQHLCITDINCKFTLYVHMSSKLQIHQYYIRSIIYINCTVIQLAYVNSKLNASVNMMFEVNML